MKARIKKAYKMRSALLLTACLLSCAASTATAASLVVLEARGAGLKAGMHIESNALLVLKEGERVSLIGPDGSSITRKGPFNGPVLATAGTDANANTNTKQALGALLASRDVRSSAVGVIRAGIATVKIPEPWLIDVTRPGPRCLIEGERPVWWRPESAAADHFAVFPVDRSWRADFVWEQGQDRQIVPPLSRFDRTRLFFIKYDDQEFAISLHIIPADLDNNLVLAAWMLEKGCLQQADALLLTLQRGLTKPE
jgi:hypothetical protein